MPDWKKITIREPNVEIAYLDTGAPHTTLTPYTTFVAVHGTGFGAANFSKIAGVAFAQGHRFISLNRREYKHSTPFSDAEKAAFQSGSEEQKMDYILSTGADIMLFIDKLVQKENLTPVKDKTGGVCLIGWSLGAATSSAAIASVTTLSEDVKVRLGSHLRAHVFLDPPSLALANPIPKQDYVPLADEYLPLGSRVGMFSRWVASYFDHGDLTSKNLNNIEYVTPSLSHVPTIWTYTPEEAADNIDEAPVFGYDLPLMFTTFPQRAQAWQTAVFSAEVKKVLPHLKHSHVLGEHSPSFGFACLWSMQEEDQKRGGGYFASAVVAGANHFMHWDKPEATLKTLLSLI